MLASPEAARWDRTAALGRQGLIAGLDIGTTKVTCFIARPEPPREAGGPRLRVVGIGHQLSRGLSGGQVVNSVDAEDSIRRAVGAAERMAGTLISRVWLTVSTATLQSRTVRAGLVIGERDLVEGDVRRILQMARSQVMAPDTAILHTVPVRYAVDGSVGVRDPQGMFAGELRAEVNIVSIAQTALRNLMLCVERCHLEIAGLVAAPYASAISALVEDEAELGALLVEMGGGSTGIAMMAEGRLRHVGVVPVGGQHVTHDIAHGLSTSREVAERLKTLCGSALVSPSDDRDMISVSRLGEDDRESAIPVPRSLLTGIIRPRIEETLELVRDHIAKLGPGRATPASLVLTGGACQLTGVKELAERILGRQVRIGRPGGLSGLAEATGGPGFTAAAGLVAFPLYAPFEASRGDGIQGTWSRLNPFGRMNKWLRASVW